MHCIYTQFRRHSQALTSLAEPLLVFLGIGLLSFSLPPLDSNINLIVSLHRTINCVIFLYSSLDFFRHFFVVHSYPLFYRKGEPGTRGEH